jgi:glyoxylate/hydroxypyruvate reductase A
MAIQIISKRIDNEVWLKLIKKALPDEDIYLYPDEGDRLEVTYALAWKPPKGIFMRYPNLKAIASMGAGVDHILNDDQFPKDLPVTRVTDEFLTKDMGEYVLAMALNYLRNYNALRTAQTNHEWKHGLYRRLSDVTVGIMGLGVLGEYTATLLSDFGGNVIGWSRSAKDLKGIGCYHGQDQFEEFLSNSGILVCLLPLTKETSGILNKQTFSMLPRGAYIINVARGQHLVDEDLLEMIASGHLSGAALDVFHQEPLPADHPLWSNEKITITPHVASFTKPASVIPQLIENYRRLSSGEPLVNVVSIDKGY